MSTTQDLDMLEQPSLRELDDERLLRVFERPDGYHWIDLNGHQEFGPFRTLALALADMDAPGEPALDEGECMEEETSWLGLELGPDGLGDDGFERAAWAVADAA
jgi:hypothetical protein